MRGTIVNSTNAIISDVGKGGRADEWMANAIRSNLECVLKIKIFRNKNNANYNTKDDNAEDDNVEDDNVEDDNDN